MLDRLSRLQLAVVAALGGAAVFGGFCALIGVLVVINGWYDVSASKPHSPLTAWLLHTTMIRSIRSHAEHHNKPDSVSQDQVKEGFDLYEQHCAMCHGGPGVAPAYWANGINPRPPYLVDSARRWSPSELKFIVSNGVKMTAMPSWQRALTPTQITSLVGFLEKLPDISTQEYRALRASKRAHDAQFFANSQ